jgi:CheY-like chemotaxis protein
MVDSDQSAVLVVDDILSMRLTMQDMLQDIGFPYVELANGVEEALSKIAIKPPIIIFSEFMMPKLDGIELLKRVRGTPSLAVIPFAFVTVISEKDSLKEAFEIGLTKHLVKPIQFSELKQFVCEVLQFSTD